MTEFFFINDLILYGIHHNELYIDMRRLSRPNPCVSSCVQRLDYIKSVGIPTTPAPLASTLSIIHCPLLPITPFLNPSEYILMSLLDGSEVVGNVTHARTQSIQSLQECIAV
jgi:hypothetical protein